MKNRYNLALVPTTKSDEVIACANQFSGIACRYLLGESSLPHVTICRFMAEDAHLDAIWADVCQSIATRSVQLKFEEFSCTEGRSTFWVALLPDNLEILHAMHRAAIGLIKNPVKTMLNYYDPHMSLLDTTAVNYQDIVKKVSASYVPIQDAFVLALGRSDEAGQLLEIIRR